MRIVYLPIRGFHANSHGWQKEVQPENTTTAVRD